METNQETTQRVATVEELARRLESFLDGQLDRFEACWSELPGDGSRPGEMAGAEEIRAFHAERDSWLAERNEAVDLLRREAMRLTDAWTRLEHEERTLAARESVSELLSTGGAAQPAAPATAPVSGPPQTHGHANGAGHPLPPRPPGATETGHPLPPASPSRSSAVRDFQQLSREIARNHPRKR